jgi:chemotaxis response regulator CheB
MTILAAQPDMAVVGEAGNGAVAVQEAQRLRPDVVVMDIQMPVLSPSR